MTESPVFSTPKPWNERYDTHVNNTWVPENLFLSAAREDKDLPAFSESRKALADPFWAGHDSAIACYWRAWELAFGNLKQPSAENDFISNYCDTAFNGNLFMWDSAFITCFGLYGRRVFNFQGTLDNFYRKQHSDGFICREIAESDGQDTFHRFDPSSTGPNVLAWVEWNYFKKTGDLQRLEKVFAPLVAFHQWFREYRTWPDGSYWLTGWGTGMDNLPRLKNGNHVNWGNGHMTWVDATFQALLSAKVLLQMASALGRTSKVTDLQTEAEQLTTFVNKYLWNDKTMFYHDRLADGRLSSVKHIGTFWALLAGSTPYDRLPGLVEHLENPEEFKRAHRVPALSADDPGYSGTGDYWCGGIWAPTNYMVLKGLDEINQTDLAHQIAKNHLDNVVRVFESDDIHWEGAKQFREYFHLSDLKFDDKHTLWENYAPDEIMPGKHSKPGYVGWTGLPPIAVFLEDVMGIQPDAAANRLTWRVRLMEDHGVRNYPFGLAGTLDIKCAARKSSLEHPSIDIHSNIPLTLEVIWDGGREIVNIEKASARRHN
jgi:hypothetical protein